MHSNPKITGDIDSGRNGKRKSKYALNGVPFSKQYSEKLPSSKTTYCTNVLF